MFLEQGFHATTMRQIATEAGIAVGGIYNHFASKEAIFDVLILEKHPYKQIIPILLSAPGETVEVWLHNTAQSVIAELDRRPDFLKLIFIEFIEFKGCHMPLLSNAFYPQAGPVWARFNPPDNRLREIPLGVVVSSFIGMILSFYLLQFMAGVSKIPEIMGNDDVSQFVDIFLNGILKPAEA